MFEVSCVVRHIVLSFLLLTGDGGVGVVVCSSPRDGIVVDVVSILAFALFGAVRYKADAAAATTFWRSVCP